MKVEKSCGIVISKRTNNTNEYLVVQSVNGHFGFPKGHVEGGETEIETAKREVFEEVRLIPSIINGFREVSEYVISDTDVKKQVVFFLGCCQSEGIILQKEELKSGSFLSYDDAMALLKYENDKRILNKADKFLTDIENTVS